MSKVSEGLQPEQYSLFEDYEEAPERPKPFSSKPAESVRFRQITDYYTAVKNLTKDVGHFNELYLLKKNLEKVVPHPDSREVFAKYHQDFATLTKKIARARQDCIDRFNLVEHQASVLGFQPSDSPMELILNHLALSVDRRERYRAVIKRELTKLLTDPDRPILSLDDLERDYQQLLIKRRKKRKKQSS